MANTKTTATPKTYTDAEKASNFKTDANAAVDRAVKALAKFARLHNAKRYSHTPEQVAKIKALLEAETAKAVAAIDGTKPALLDL